VKLHDRSATHDSKRTAELIRAPSASPS
jgi:hypothetical protein